MTFHPYQSGYLAYGEPHDIMLYLYLLIGIFVVAVLFKVIGKFK